MSYILGLVTGDEKPALTFVVPLKDEEATIAALFGGIALEATKVSKQWEVIFIDDGSTDSSWAVIEKLARENQEHIKAVRFRHNAGKAAALEAGWRESKGDIIFTMDADLQDDPKEIPRFLEKMREGFDVVTGWKQKRHDPWHKVLPSRIFNILLSWVSKVKLHDHNCGFKCYRREVTQAIPMYGEMHRMVPSLAAMHGFNTAEIPVNHHPRMHGKSKYGVKRFLRGYLDMWTVFFLQNFRQRPMHLMGSVSIAMLGFGAVLALFVSRISLPFSVFLLLSSALPVLLLGAVLTAMIGFLAEWNVHNQCAEPSKPHHQPIAQTIGVTDGSPLSQFSLHAPLTNDARASVIGMTALLLDDKLAVRERNAVYLKNAGWNVLTAASCNEAQSKLNGEVDVILLDPCLQDGTDGLSMVEFVRCVYQNNDHSPKIIFLPSIEAGVSSAVATAMHRGLLNYHLGEPALHGFRHLDAIARNS
jgi:glycosyltransferase involved in cell wall biosynthesis